MPTTGKSVASRVWPRAAGERRLDRGRTILARRGRVLGTQLTSRCRRPTAIQPIERDEDRAWRQVLPSYRKAEHEDAPDSV